MRTRLCYALHTDFNGWPEWFTKSDWWLVNQSRGSTSQQEIWVTEQLLQRYSVGGHIVCIGWQMQSRKTDKAEFLISIPTGSSKEGCFGELQEEKDDEKGFSFVFFPPKNDLQLTKLIAAYMFSCSWSFLAGYPIVYPWSSNVQQCEAPLQLIHHLLNVSRDLYAPD